MAPSACSRLVFLLAAFGVLAGFGGSARGEVVRLEVLRREPFAGGRQFGETGAYELLTGTVRYAVDPGHLRNSAVVDLDRAPRNSAGRVEFAADFWLLKPADLSRANGCLLYDVNNRGNRTALRFFSSARGEGEAGDGFLLRSGYSVLSSGWIGELLPGGDRLLLQAPIATNGGRDIIGPVRFEMICDAPAETIPLSRREGHGSYPPTERGEAEGTLTWRLREGDPRLPISRAQWALIRAAIPESSGVPGTLGQIRLRLSGGFQPGYIYELIYEARGPLVQGLGNVAVRDLVSYLKHSAHEANPLRRAPADPVPVIDRALGFGVSQCGRFLRNFVHDGFNLDEADRRVFEGLIVHVSGGGLGFFNHRFAQPTRHNSQHEEHLYPADRFPFTYGPSVDPYSGKTEAILPAYLPPEASPRIFHTQSAAEYWHRSGSLVHTDPLGRRDIEVPDRVRIYAFGGTQHGPGSQPSRGIGQQLTNPADYRPFLKALLVALDAWTREGREPPASVYPRLSDGTLIEPALYAAEFPAIPGVRPPEVIQRPPARDLGPEFATRGIISIEPPRVLGRYTTLVPRPDKLGNDQGCLLLPEVAVPLATYTGWNLRARSAGAENQLWTLMGSYIPLPATRSERESTADPRPSAEELYGSADERQKRLAAVKAELQSRRLLLPEDAE